MNRRSVQVAVAMAATVAVVATVLLVGGAGHDGATRPPERAGTATTTTASADGTDTTVTTGPPATAPPTTSPPVPPIEWEPCGDAECATVPSPVDHDGGPGGPMLDVFVTRLPATGDRIGALFVDFGGPGAGAADRVRRFPFPDAVRARFDIVGMDPRGVGRSTPLDCGLEPATLHAADPTVEDEADARALVEVSERYANDCAATHGDLLPHMGTNDVARDLDRVRAAMGDGQVSFLGFSYGTVIGQAYAEAFPSRVRAMILDGVVDPAPTGLEMATVQARGFEAALANWAAGCPARSSCPFGDGALAAADEVLALAEGGIPSPAGIPSSAGIVGPGEAAVGLALPLYQESSWPHLDLAVADALDGDGEAMLRLARQYFALLDFAAYFAVLCRDFAWPGSPDEVLAAGAAAAAVAPRFGEAIVNDHVRCAVWPAPPAPIGAVAAPDTPPILVVSTTGDPATPYENGVRVADRLASGVLLSVDGEDHTVTFQGSACVDAVSIAYLVDLAVPADRSRC